MEAKWELINIHLPKALLFKCFIFYFEKIFFNAEKNVTKAPLLHHPEMTLCYFLYCICIHMYNHTD